ncbi:hypothetical protein AAMO2058_001490700 [Amorphochlora amoebiformis]
MGICASAQNDDPSIQPADKTERAGNAAKSSFEPGKSPEGPKNREKKPCIATISGQLKLTNDEKASKDAMKDNFFSNSLGKSVALAVARHIDTLVVFLQKEIVAAQERAAARKRTAARQRTYISVASIVEGLLDCLSAEEAEIPFEEKKLGLLGGPRVGSLDVLKLTPRTPPTLREITMREADRKLVESGEIDRELVESEVTMVADKITQRKVFVARLTKRRSSVKLLVNHHEDIINDQKIKSDSFIRDRLSFV